jgi:PEP-CTERM motif
MRTLLATAAAAILVAGGAHAAANLIVNGGFETGDFTGWTAVDPSGETFVSVAFGPYVPNSGTYFAALGAIGGDGTVSQTFADTPGATYESSFYLANDGDTPNDFTVTGPGSLFLGPLTDLGAFPYTQYFGFFTGSGLDTITFAARNDPGFFSLDDVSVVEVSVPEPATWASMILGLGFAGVALRRRKAIAAA